MNLEAMSNCVIIKPRAEKHELFVLTQTEKPESGDVLAVGPDCTAVKVGDYVYFGIGQEFSYNGDNHIVIREEHISAVWDV